MATKGKVKWWSAEKGYGFIRPDEGGADLFVHFSEIEGTGRRDLLEAQAVEWDGVRETPRGLQATGVRPIADPV